MFKLTENLFGCLLVIAIIFGFMMMCGLTHQKFGFETGNWIMLIGSTALAIFLWWYGHAYYKECPDCKNWVPKNHKVCTKCHYRWKS